MDSRATIGENFKASRLTQSYVYVGGLVTYMGEATAGTATSAAFWRIKKFFYSGTDVIGARFADGNELFDNIMDNAPSLTYP